MATDEGARVRERLVNPPEVEVYCKDCGHSLMKFCDTDVAVWFSQVWCDKCPQCGAYRWRVRKIPRNMNFHDSPLFREEGPEVGEHASPARKAQKARRLVSREREKRAPTKNG